MASYKLDDRVSKRLTAAEIEDFKTQFSSFDCDGDANIDVNELGIVMESLGEKVSKDELVKLIAEVDTNKSGTIDFSEFVTMILKMREGSMDTSSGFAAVYKKQAKLLQVKGMTGLHSFSEEEKAAFSNHINYTLEGDEDLADKLPIDVATMDLFRKVNDGTLLCKLVNAAQENTIDERAINKKPKNAFEVNENQNLLINSAKAIGCSITNIGANDLNEGKEHLVLGLIWQIVKIQLLGQISLTNHPFLVRLLEDGEELSALLRLPPDQILLRWFNFHLKNAGTQRRVANFGRDVKDSECYLILLNQIGGDKCPVAAGMEQENTHKRATFVLNNARALEVRPFLSANDIASGNSRLNMAFCAAIFNKCPGLDPPEPEEEIALDLAGLLDDDIGDTREERAFRMWINSLGIDSYVNNLFEDVKNGVVLLQVMDKVQPGIVSWKKVNLNPKNAYKKVENTNYAVLLGKQLKFSLVNVGGKDIMDGNKKLTLALIWQMMRLHMLNFLKNLSMGGKPVTEDDMIKWANDQVAGIGRTTRMKNFRDSSLKTSLFLFDLMHSVEKRTINWDLVTAGETDEDAEANAKYAISVARKLGCTVFALWEDIVEVKPKMILTFIGALMAVQFRERRASMSGGAPPAASQ